MEYDIDICIRLIWIGGFKKVLVGNREGSKVKCYIFCLKECNDFFVLWY